MKENKHSEIDNLNSKQEAMRLSEDIKILKEESNMFSSEHIGSKVVTLLTSETSSSENNFNNKFQSNFGSSHQSFDKQ